MKKILLILMVINIGLASEGMPFLNIPDIAQDGYLPSSPVSEKNGVSFTYGNLFVGTDYTAISAIYDGYEIGFKGLMADEIGIWGEVPTDEPVGTTSYYNTSFYLGKKFEINEKWSISARAKLLSERLFYASSLGGALDAEVSRTFNVNWRVLAGVKNFGMMSALNTESTQLPIRYYVGGDVIFNFFILSVQGGVTSDIDPYFRWGVRYFHPVFDISYSYDNITRSHHVGADIKWRNFKIGYGQYFHQQGLSSMMITFGVGFK